MKTDTVNLITHFLLRVVAGLIIMQAGGTKILDWFGGVPAQFGGHPAFLTQAWIGGVFELYGGMMVLTGLCTRFAAFILSGQMAIAYFQFHQPNGTWPAQNGGIPAVLLCFIFLFLAASGSGPWSLDAVIARKRKK